MPEIIREAKTIEAAIELALKDLGCLREEAEITVMREPAKGIFGMQKSAKIKAIYNNAKENGMSTTSQTIKEEFSQSEIDNASERAEKTLKKILSLMGMGDLKINVSNEENNILLEICSDAEGLIIGKYGQNLSSLQYLINRIIHKNDSNTIRYVVDVGGYKVRHKLVLEKMAKRIAKKVFETKKEEQLKAMSAYDRRIIHLCIKEDQNVVTYSLGEGNYRRVVIAPK